MVGGFFPHFIPSLFVVCCCFCCVVVTPTRTLRVVLEYFYCAYECFIDAGAIKTNR